MHTYWLSIVGDAGSAIVLVDAPTFEDAMQLLTAARIHPGGQVVGQEITEAMKQAMGEQDAARVRDLPRLTLLTAAQIEAAGLRSRSID